MNNGLQIPRWVDKEWECYFCWNNAEPTKIEITNDINGREVVRVEFECQNPKCKYLKMDIGKHISVGLYGGPRPDQYREFLKNKESEQPSKVSGQKSCNFCNEKQ